ncbi:MAG: class IV adenylate cyclase [Deltaproteobacteria bacterium]|nr:class IV adenylate cyclase [Deltaproteobacteria bacterium]
MGGQDLEVEVKFLLRDKEEARKRVLSLGAESMGRVFEQNVLYDTPDRDLERTGRLLRLRTDHAAVLTFKGPRKAPDGGYKVHEEHEVTVSSYSKAVKILKGIGFFPARAYEKHRETFVLGSTKILLDEMPFGDFLELEGEKDAIRDTAARLGLAWGTRITENYLEIFSVVKDALGLSFDDPTFENFQGLGKEDLLRAAAALRGMEGPRG